VQRLIVEVTSLFRLHPLTPDAGINVYACLVCGKYFQGRGNNTHAYTHSVSEGHRVFLNLDTKKFYCLPDNYEVIDAALGDILYVLNPTFESALIRRLETSTKDARAYDGTNYIPGVVGLNNIKANDYLNVILQAMSHVEGLRNYFLGEGNYAGIVRPPGDQSFHLVTRFGELIRKLWNPKNFKAHVSPHEMLQAVVLCSKKKFQITEQVQTPCSSSPASPPLPPASPAFPPAPLPPLPAPPAPAPLPPPPPPPPSSSSPLFSSFFLLFQVPTTTISITSLNFTSPTRLSIPVH
jgi:hypothetical protein